MNIFLTPLLEKALPRLNEINLVLQIGQDSQRLLLSCKTNRQKRQAVKNCTKGFFLWRSNNNKSNRIMKLSKISGFGENPFSLMSKGTVLILMTIFILMGCRDQRMQTIKWTEYEPVYMTEQEFRSAVDMEESRELENPGKIYFYDQYLFVNEVNEGVYVIDNSDPAAPEKIGFINIPANKDMAVKDDLLYADSQSDLLVFDIENIDDPQLITRKEDVFKRSANEAPGIMHSQIDPSKGVVVDWKEVEVEEVCTNDCASLRPEVDILTADNAVESFNTGGSSTGVGGSMARFVITGDYLYAVDKQNLLTFDVASEEPSQSSMKNVGWAIETIFAYESSLFIGSESAMYIYDISTPASPAQLSEYQHLTACDPVVVEGNFAFVTLRNGNRCNRGVNRLEVINVEDQTSPFKVATYEMINPHGLGIDDGDLFISEGDMGLKIMNADNPLEIKLLRHIEDIKTFDVIPFNNVLMVTGEDGIRQYDYSNIKDIKHLSTITVSQDSSDKSYN